MNEQVLTPNGQDVGVPDPASLIAEVDFGQAPVPAEQVAADEPLPEGQEAEPQDEEERRLAISRGWAPKEDWNEARARRPWLDVKEFNEHYEQVMPLVLKGNKSLIAKNERLEAEVQELKRFREQYEADQQERAKFTDQVQESTLKQEWQAAMENQDFGKAAEANAALQKLYAGREVARRQPAPPPGQPQIAPEVKQLMSDFLTSNPEFKDQTLFAHLGVEAKAMHAAQFPAQGLDFLNAAADRVRRMYADKFQRPRRPAMAETGGAPTPGRSTNGRSWNDLKPEVRNQMDQFIRTTPQLHDMGMEKARASMLSNASPNDFRGR